MKISNETKIGSLTSIAIVLLILGVNFLKGKSFTSKNTTYYAVFDNIEGLSTSNPVIINGKQVGTVLSTDGGRDMRRIVVSMNMSQDVDIPDNSTVSINPSLLGTTSLDITLGTTNTFYKNGDTIVSKPNAGIFGSTIQKIDPILAQVTTTLTTLNAFLNNINGALDKDNIRSTMNNINKTTAGLAASTASLESALGNVSSFTGNLAGNNQKINDVVSNLQTTTANFSKVDLQKTLNTLNGTITQLQTDLGSNNGTLGKLLNDNSLYNNLTATSNKLNLLLDDVRVHPKRYINVSVFGKKDKNTPLMVPLPDTVNAPYLRK